ncbi:unnamed protein product [Rotaria socialis]|uniref:Uncharacterized protein n=1 Tax=Rotaria socialis TaxID=392032 RepID=A0A820ZA33_9BILA|nr:unnamed protein product [Rotaria socialis]CAF3339254.1 unnamed protein product [Rotaria socialis]CAF3363754.1 unnamed protein product [Rotaria socialis]CAF3387314.1 unnamed protein product [Rotaria socialis]CAF4561824.1 unnamed protein product [Rotaria socialis]
MVDSQLLNDFRDRIQDLGTTYSISVKNMKTTDDELDRLEAELEAAANRLKEELDKQLKMVLDKTRMNKPPPGAGPEDPEYKKYKSLLENVVAGINNTTSWLVSIFQRIQGIIGSIIDKIKKKASDIIDCITKWFQHLVNIPL